MTDVRPRLLDLFCGAGGASVGYSHADFDVVGVDIAPQPNYPFEFHRADALAFPLDGFDAIHASPPCQAFTQAQRLRGNVHPEFVGPIRDRLIAAGVPWVIENVPGAPLRDPVMLCGAMFPPLRVYRHRLFETNFWLPQPPEPPHIAPQTKMGRSPGDGEWIQVVGNFSGVEFARAAMGAPWMTRDELAESIPPAYSEWVGRFVMAEVLKRRRGRLFG